MKTNLILNNRTIITHNYFKIVQKANKILNPNFNIEFNKILSL